MTPFQKKIYTQVLHMFGQAGLGFAVGALATLAHSPGLSKDWLLNGLVSCVGAIFGCKIARLVFGADHAKAGWSLAAIGSITVVCVRHFGLLA
jgi:hypothetical protein